MKISKWLMPGLKVKRWLFIFAVGIILCGLGFATIFRIQFWGMIEGQFYYLLINLLGDSGPLVYAGGLVFCLGLFLAFLAFRATVESILEGIGSLPVDGIINSVYEQRQLERGPKIVAIGGGTGLSNLLRGLKEVTTNITAVVVVTDDGGSSGRLREEFGVLPPGDIRNCLVALADKESLMEKLFQHRFEGNNDFSGHSFGNLFITTLSEVTGDFLQAIRESSKVLAVRGKVYPGTLENVTLGAELVNGKILKGETTITKGGAGIRRVFLEPGDAAALPEVLEAIEDADAVVIGPGSLYTSVMPNLLLKDLVRALEITKAVRIFVCNVMTQPGETDGYTASDHVKAVLQHAGKVIDYTIVHSGVFPEMVLTKYRAEGSFQVEPDVQKIEQMGIRYLVGNLADQSDLARHDSRKLATLIMKLLVRTKPNTCRQGLCRWIKKKRK